ncbi:MAG: sigma-70 family RNA polymerase sigma factor [Deltaproteobacteria bacterium]|nr:sigma-70 family RNA polymerase sigma factor [Deltaproteobacteria bacterium]MCW5807646.1 sigma-70 family RNA polymerase sigma factor [Deltaproteobacteria bacterium]
MAAIVTKPRTSDSSPERIAKSDRTRQGRVARVTAKAPRRRKDGKADLPAAKEDAELDLEHDADEAEEEAGESETAAASSESADKKRGDGGTYLSMYFRDMAALDVLRPEEEFTSAREIEALEIMLWEAVLAHAPAVEHVLAAVEPVLVSTGGEGAAFPAEVKALRKAAEAPDAKTWSKLVARAARKLRGSDVDHLFIDAALGTIDRISAGIGARGAHVGTLGRERARAEWMRRVASTNRAAAEARNDFVKANLRLVVSIARRFNHGRMALADLIQEGNIGLMKAVERYDYRRGFRFSTYASWWIRHAISRALADKGREVRLPVHMIDAQHRLTKARRQLTGQLGRQPTSEELATATQMPLEKIEKMRSWLLEQSISIDKPVGDDEGRVLGEVLEDPEREDVSPTGDLEWEALTTEVRDLLHELRPIEADILRQRFGLGTEQELTLKEIGDKYNLSRERIRQLQEQALAKMRRALARRDLM